MPTPTEFPNQSTQLIDFGEYWVRKVFLQIPSRTPNPKSNDKNSEKGREKIFWLQTRMNETER